MKIEETKEIKDACIYRITFPNGMKYIGQTKDLSKRFNLYATLCNSDFKDNSQIIDKIRNVGLENIEIDILTTISTKNKSDLLLCLSILEIKYIRSENSLSPNGYNNSIGGELLGIPLEYLSTEFNINFGCKPILVYDSDGLFLNEYNSIKECAYGLGVDSKTIRPMIDRRDTLFASKYMLRYKKYDEVPKEIVPFKPKKVKKTIYEVNKIEKTVYKEKNIYKKYQILKYNADGEYCGIYDTSSDAALSIGRSSIRKGVLTGGYIFLKYDGGDIKQNIGKVIVNGYSTRSRKYSEALTAKAGENIPPLDMYIPNNNDFKVGKYSLDGTFIEQYNSIREAVAKNNINYNVVWANIYGKTKKGKNFLWRKIED